MRSYILTDREVERLLAWLRTGNEYDTTRMLFVDVRRNFRRIMVHTELMMRVSRELRRQGRWAGRAMLPRELNRKLRAAQSRIRSLLGSRRA